MKISRSNPLHVWWLALLLAIAPLGRAQSPEAPSAPAAAAPATEPADESKPAEVTAPAAEEAPAKVEAASTPVTEELPETELREVSAEADDVQTVEEGKSETELRDLTKGGEKSKAKKKRVSRRYEFDTDVQPMGDTKVPAGRRQSEAISIMGSTVVDGEVSDAAVSILGNTTVNGKVYGEAVSVLGTTRVNGYVRGETVAVLGDVILGPNAEVGGDVVAVGGRVVREEGATIGGNITQIGGFGDFGDFAWLRAYIAKCVRWGRPLWVGENLGWLWMIAGGFLVFYMLLALIFPRGVERCATVLEERPGSTILATVLTALLTPVLMVLLVATGIGAILIPFIGAGMFIAILFGKAAVLAWFGRRITGHFDRGPMAHAVMAVFFGGLIVALLYMIPFLGFLLQQFFSVLGLGMVVYVLILASRREKAMPVGGVAAAVPAAPYVAAPVTPVVPVAPVDPVATGVAGTVEGLPPPTVPVVPVAPIAPMTPPVVISAATLPRVGFWLRLAAGIIDFIILGITMGLLDEILWFDFDGPGVLFLGLAAYSATLWKLRGTTIGGIICGLKVVRTDDRPIDWTISIVRALSAFLSFALVGLGFIWVAFDDEKQSWHDKIAGTTIVKVPKGISLL